MYSSMHARQAMAATAEGTTDGLPIGEEEPTTTTPEKPSSEGGAICAALVIGVVYLSISVVHFFSHGQRLFDQHDPVEYTVAIAAVSGLNPAKDLHAGLLDPAFNLTLRVASPRTAKGRECVNPGTAVEVSYPRSGVPLATGTAPAFCVDVGERREEGSMIAWGDGVRLPELVLDSLAADMLRGAAEFGVRLTPLPDCRSCERFCSDTVDVDIVLGKGRRRSGSM
ncbi:hypothetical protein BDA96_06G005800 [Sorghum bicolor]|uniref:Uncharacterized protein n=1 Tax=Sorghum bicolor TaxID=4558 RepID=A0A921UBW7_SORBI|nr:hypothetical protein BDA96_06G005800 [Sorghum bicolor]